MYTTTVHAIVGIVREILFLSDGEPIDPDLALIELPGWDSINQIELIVQVEERFSIRLTEADLRDCRTLRDVIHAVEAKAGA
ncbi:acyl carrier protein [Micromonospora sp. RP3T]|uniref:acyl carrier protein n=1 Tax=Micromonospora sp. RP3T TaxID=2135446 RepID=UPI003D7369A3